MKEIGAVSANDRVTEETVINFDDIFKSVFNINITERLLSELDYTYDIYKELLEKFEQVEDKEMLSSVLCFNETVYLHSMELNNSDEKLKLIKSLNDETIRKDSISYICEKHITYNNVIIPNIKRLHTILMEGIALKRARNKSFRNHDDMFVGFWIDESTKYVQYYPTMYKDIEKEISKVLVYLNDPELNKAKPNTFLGIEHENFDEKYALFVQPLIAQALFIIIQPFQDGNSRTARAINYASMLNHTNQIFGKNYNLPIVYLSKYYFPYKKQYRMHIKDLALEPNSEKWQNWLIFSLHSMQEYIDYLSNLIDENQLIPRNKQLKKKLF